MSMSDMRLTAFSLMALLCLSSTTKAARILGVFTVAGKSHFSCNEAIMKSLHAAGHNITMISPFPSEKKIENFTYIDSSFGTSIHVGNSKIQDFTENTLSYKSNMFIKADLQHCYDIMKIPEIQEALYSTKKLYDVMFVELLMAYECYLPIAQKLNIPAIGTVTHRSWKPADEALGVPSNPAVIPLEIGSSDPKIEMSLLDRIENLWYSIVSDYYFHIKMRPMIDKFYREYFTEDLLYKKDLSLIFYNNHPSFLPRSTPPNAIEIGGVHVKLANPLPKNIQTFIEEAPHGVILFTFGSEVKASSLPLEQREAFLTAFASIPQRVIWKFEEPIENLPKNIMISKWLPQRDILEHKNVIAFMSHCGQGGVYEAVITGTPVVTIPLAGDQLSNAALLQYRGVGVNLKLKTVTEETVLAALNSIVNDTSYYQRMQKLSCMFKDRPMTPQESIVYWTEYVIRHNGTAYLKPLGRNMPFYKYFMLDIIMLALVVISVVAFTSFLGARKIYVLVAKKSKHEISVKKDK